MKIGDLVSSRRTISCDPLIGIVIKLSKNKEVVEVAWLTGDYLTPLQYIKSLEVINESR